MSLRNLIRTGVLVALMAMTVPACAQIFSGSQTPRSAGRAANAPNWFTLIGHVSDQRTWELGTSSPSLLDFVQLGGGLLPTASGQFRVIRGGREVQQGFMSPQTRISLMPNDVVIVDGKLGRGKVFKGNRSDLDATQDVRIAVMGVLPYAIVTQLPPDRATLRFLTHQLGQSEQTAARARLVQSRPANFTIDSSLADLSVVMFDPSSIDPSRLPPAGAFPAPTRPGHLAGHGVEPGLLNGALAEASPGSSPATPSTGLLPNEVFPGAAPVELPLPTNRSNSVNGSITALPGGSLGNGQAGAAPRWPVQTGPAPLGRATPFGAASVNRPAAPGVPTAEFNGSEPMSDADAGAAPVPLNRQEEEFVRDLLSEPGAVALDVPAVPRIRATEPGRLGPDSQHGRQVPGLQAAQPRLQSGTLPGGRTAARSTRPAEVADEAESEVPEPSPEATPPFQSYVDGSNSPDLSANSFPQSEDSRPLALTPTADEANGTEPSVASRAQQGLSDQRPSLARQGADIRNGRPGTPSPMARVAAPGRQSSQQPVVPEVSDADNANNEKPIEINSERPLTATLRAETFPVRDAQTPDSSRFEPIDSSFAADPEAAALSDPTPLLAGRSESGRNAPIEWNAAQVAMTIVGVVSFFVALFLLLTMKHGKATPLVRSRQLPREDHAWLDRVINNEVPIVDEPAVMPNATQFFGRTGVTGLNRRLDPAARQPLPRPQLLDHPHSRPLPLPRSVTRSNEEVDSFDFDTEPQFEPTGQPIRNPQAARHLAARQQASRTAAWQQFTRQSSDAAAAPVASVAPEPVASPAPARPANPANTAGVVLQLSGQPQRSHRIDVAETASAPSSSQKSAAGSQRQPLTVRDGRAVGVTPSRTIVAGYDVLDRILNQPGPSRD